MQPVLHRDELAISSELVRRLVDSQFPDYAKYPLRSLEQSGSTNRLFRLGEEFLVRLPRQRGGGNAIIKEHNWLPSISCQLPIAVPQLVGVGQPDSGYSEYWSIVGWIDGHTPSPYTTDGSASLSRPSSMGSLAIGLADVISALRIIDLPDPVLEHDNLRNYRGRPLVEFDTLTRQNIQACRTIKGLSLDADLALATWQHAMILPEAHIVSEDRWYHGDLVGENLLLANDKLTAVLDFGELAIGDPTIDLHGAWELFNPIDRETFRARLDVNDAQWCIGRAWALGISLNAIPYYWRSMPNRMKHRVAMVKAVLMDAQAQGIA